MAEPSQAVPTARELWEIARRYVHGNDPGSRLEWIELKIVGIKKRARVVVNPLSDGCPAVVAEDEHGAAVSQSVNDILACLEAARRPLTKTRLLQAMAERCARGEGGEWSESTIMRRIAMLMEDGTVINPPDARPRGYRLADS
jgi:hypothetical protein